MELMGQTWGWGGHMGGGREGGDEMVLTPGIAILFSFVFFSRSSSQVERQDQHSGNWRRRQRDRHGEGGAAGGAARAPGGADRVERQHGPAAGGGRVQLGGLRAGRRPARAALVPSALAVRPQGDWAPPGASAGGISQHCGPGGCLDRPQQRGRLAKHDVTSNPDVTCSVMAWAPFLINRYGAATWLNLSLLRVINVIFFVQPHQKYNITHYDELGFS